MFKNEQTTVNGHGFFRKKKAYGLVCGIALGLSLFLNAGQVSANEVTTESITSATEQVAGQAVLEPASKELTSAVDTAKSAGVTVTEEATQSVKTVEEAQADYATQAKDIEAVTAKQEAINAENKALQTAYDEADKTVSTVNKEAKELVTSYPNAKLEEKQVDFGDGTSVSAYQAGKAEAEATSAENKQAVATYLAEKAEVDRKNAETKKREDEIKQSAIYQDKKNQIYVTGDFDSSKQGLAFYKNIKVTSFDKTSSGVKFLGWGKNTKLEAPQGLSVENMTYSDEDHSIFHKFTNVKKGSSFILRNMGETVDGKAIHAKVTFTHTKPMENVTDSYLELGMVNRGGALSFHYLNFDRLGVTFDYFADDNAPLKLLIASVIGDVDYGQASQVKLAGNDLNYINPEGSGLTESENGLVSREDMSVANYSHAPLGTYVVVGASDKLEYVHTTDRTAVVGGLVRQRVQFDLFGISSFVNVGKFDYLDDPQLVLKTVSTPPKPILKENLAITYHLNTYPHQLTTSKDVTNLDGVSIDSGELKIGDKAVYTLRGAKVLANGKDKLIKYDVEDKLDIEHDKYLSYKVYAFLPIKLTDGTVLESMSDLKEFAKQVYDEATGRFYVSLHSDFLAKIAKDSDVQVAVDILFERIKTGDVVNTFNNYLAFEDVEGNVTEVPLLSNEVITHTPEEPKVLEAPKPTPPAPKAPIQPAVILPEAGVKSSSLGVLGVALLVLLGFVSFKKGKEKA